MREEHSLVGSGVVKVSGARRVPRTHRSIKNLALSAFVCALAAMLAVVLLAGTVEKANQPAKSLTVTIIPGVPLINQYHDTPMVCQACVFWGLPPGPHAWNDAKGPDGIYGTPDDCPHCSAYCAPASISMISLYRARGPPATLQDNIYDAGKQTNGEVPMSGMCEVHGFGMFQGTGGQPQEVQMAMIWAVSPIIQHDQNPVNPNGPMTAAVLQQYIAGWTPVLWLDVGGFPKNQSPTNPPPGYRLADMGHAKVIVGYDDAGTAADTSDDLCLINDPWPEYNDLGILPANCTQGPGGSWDPYWQPLNDVNLTDPLDIYLVDSFPAIPEFGSTIVPVLGLVIVAVVAFRRRLV